jgi:glutathione synthase/RimK-type ligase-like ATP-grasp enzyme
MLLVVTNKKDLTSDYFILRLRERGIPYLRLNTEDYPEAFSIELRADDNATDASITCRGADAGVTLADVQGVYFRRPIPPSCPELEMQDKGFAVRESLEALRSLWRHIPHKRWLNHPSRIQLASNKLEQLTLARSLGLRVPRTLLTDSPRSIRDFHAECNGQAIVKAVKHGFVKGEHRARLAFTTELDDALLEEWDSFARVPVLAQERIEKECDIRVTVIGHEVFSTAIYSQSRPGTKLDWRRMDILGVEIEHRAVELPVALRDQCRRLTRHFGLGFSAIDLVLARTGDYVFLELNPNGQWAWLEQKAGHPIRDAMIDHLLRTTTLCKRVSHVG